MKLQPPTKRNGKVAVVRWAISAGPVKQTNIKAPAKKGWWAFFEGCADITITGASLDRLCPAPPDLPGRDCSEARWEQFRAERDAWAKRQKEIAKNHFKMRTFQLPLEAVIFCGWTRNGEVTRSGFFNSGPWQQMMVEHALKGLTRMIARSKAPRCGLDTADLQIFIPHPIKL